MNIESFSISSIIFDFTKSFLLLMILCFAEYLNIKINGFSSTKKNIISGLIFGIVASLGMLIPVELGPGVIIDARSVVVSIAGVWGGPVVALLATSLSSITRILIGGAGASIGIFAIITSAIIGVIYGKFRLKKSSRFFSIELLSMGLIIHIIILFQWKFLDVSLLVNFINIIEITFVVIFSLTTVVLGRFLFYMLDREISDNKRKEIAAKFEAVSRALPDILLLIDGDGNYIESLSSGNTKFSAYAKNLVGKKIEDFFPDFETKKFIQLINDTITTGVMHQIEYKIKKSNGVRYYEGRAHPLGIAINRHPAIVFISRDITERKNAEISLQESERRFRSVLHSIPHIAIQGYLEDGTITYWNNASSNLYGYSADEIIGQNLIEFIVPEGDRTQTANQIHEMFEREVVFPPSERKLQHKNGEPIYIYSSRVFVKNSYNEKEAFCFDIDISRRKNAEEESKYLSYFDALTGLHNRRYFLNWIQQLTVDGNFDNECHAVFFIDLDNFKNINDTKGHSSGDSLLKIISDRLKTLIYDKGIVSRMGGDEFVILLNGLPTNNKSAVAIIESFANEILDSIRKPIFIEKSHIKISACIGASIISSTNYDANEILKQADMAMYKAKEKNRDTFCLFTQCMQKEIDRRLAIEADLISCLNEGDFEILYQPQFDIDTNIVGAEALIRWNHPIYGDLFPSEFIPIAEDTALIIPLGLWIIERVFEEQAEWKSKNNLLNLTISINISAVQILHDNFVLSVKKILWKTKAEPKNIKFELTESILLTNHEKAIQVMNDLKEVGFQFSLDDFGTGYSSLSYLKLLPISQIKLDQSFVRGMIQNKTDLHIAHSIIQLAENLNITVIAEGVETEEHLKLLCKQKCRFFQGYLFAKPMKLIEFKKMTMANTIKAKFIS